MPTGGVRTGRRKDESRDVFQGRSTEPATYTEFYTYLAETRKGKNATAHRAQPSGNLAAVAGRAGGRPDRVWSLAMGEHGLLIGLIFVAALLYSSVGHAGASGYLAAMALVGVAPEVMKPTALALNILIATIATVRYYRAGYFYWAALWPFAIGSIPLSFVGGAIILPGYLYKPAVGLVLLYAAYSLFRSTVLGPPESANKGINIPTAPAVASGGLIGLLAGLTGTGGGIFLSPLLLFTGWAGTRPTSGASAAFILVNSVAGLAGSFASIRYLPDALPVWALAAAVGGLIGSELGSRKLQSNGIRRALAAVLVIAGLKLMLT